MNVATHIDKLRVSNRVRRESAIDARARARCFIERAKRAMTRQKLLRPRARRRRRHHRRRRRRHHHHRLVMLKLLINERRTHQNNGRQRWRTPGGVGGAC